MRFWGLAGGCAFLVVLGVVLGLPALTGLTGAIGVPLQLLLALAAVALSLEPRTKPPPPRLVLAIALAASLALALTAAAVWPNSADEYGYLYLARTLLAGRVFNPPPPVPELFDVYWIGVKGGRMASQYAPGWPAVLAPFLAAHIGPAANPLLLVALGALLLASLKQLGSPPAARAGLLALVMLAPFTLLNGASYFNHVLAAVAVMGVCWLQLRDDSRESAWNKLGIGAFLSLALVTRNEVFALTAAMLGVDLLARRRWRAFQAVLPAGLGALPLTLLWLAYTAAVTGSPFVSTQAWAAPEELAFGIGPLGAMFAKQAAYVSALGSFTGVAVLLLYAAALWMRFRSGTLRFYDGLLPAAVAFFVFYPSDGGHQYGPRYWFFAWPAAALTIGAASRDHAGFALLGRWRVHLPTLAVLQSAAYLSFTLSFAVVLRLYVDTRRAVYDTFPPATPAVVLIPDRQFRLGWQPRPFRAHAKEFSRNDLDFHNPVLYGRGDKPQLWRLACTLPGRHLYLWEGPGSLRPLPCPDAPPP